jgi:alpha-1,2-glucosyltransferase
VLLFHLLKNLTIKQELPVVLWRTIALTLFPLHLFFHFVYYTDSGSTFFVLLCYLLASHRKYNLSGIAGVVAVLFRQTNVVWVAFVAFASLLRDFEAVEPTRGMRA